MGQAFMSIVILIVAIIIQYFIAKQFESVAADKGYTDSKYFHFCFWLGPVGYLLVIALPDRGHGRQGQYDVANTPGFNPADNYAPPANYYSAQNCDPAVNYNPAPFYPPAAAPQQTPPPSYQPVSHTHAIVVGETNIMCGNCQRVQFKGNKSCSQCGAQFISFR